MSDAEPTSPHHRALYAEIQQKDRVYVRGGGIGGLEMVLRAYRKPLEIVAYLKYIGHPLSEKYGDWPSVIVKIYKAWKIWACLSSILGR